MTARRRLRQPNPRLPAASLPPIKYRWAPLLTLALALAVSSWHPCTAAPSPEAPQVLRSRSGQFAIARSTATAPRSKPASAEDASLVELEPGTLVLTSERVRRALLNELQQPDRWQGRVYLVINPQLTNNSPALIGAQHFTQGWQYRIELPARIEPAKLIRGLVQVLLLEFANRSHPTRSAELPLWLTEGFTQHLLESALFDLVVRPPVADNRSLQIRRTMQEQVGYDPLKSARERLRTHAALSFSRMSELTPANLPEETWLTFQACTHLFLARLLDLPGARQAIAAMLSELPHQLNWQTSFFALFQPKFSRMLDVEKWWSVVLVQFTGIDSLNTWSLSVALDKLDQLLLVPVLVGTDPQSLPAREKVTVQQILENWDFLTQQNLLQSLVQQFTLYRARTPPELIELSNDYQKTLRDYLARRASVGRARSLPGLPSTMSDLLVRDTVKRLDSLDQQRIALRTSLAMPDNTSAPGLSPTPQPPSSQPAPSAPR